MNGTETKDWVGRADVVFYSSVILNGTETTHPVIHLPAVFYSSVILNGTETLRGLMVETIFVLQ